jgi:peptidyl-Lys metalloendopeptidase
MRRISTLLIIVVAFAGGWSQASSLQGVLTPTLELDTGKGWVDVDEAVSIRFTLTNNGAETLLVLGWQTPINGIEHDILSVELNGEPVTYTGILAKRAAPRAEDYIEIAPGDSVSVSFDPTAAYDMTVTGEYSVRYRTALLDVGILSAEKTAIPLAHFSPIESNSVALWMEGLPASWHLTKGVDCNKKPDHPHCTGGGGGGGGGGGAIEFVGCDSRQQSKALGGYEGAQTISAAAYADLQAGSSLYETWFGTYANNRYSTVTSHFDAISDAFANETVTINCTDANLPYYAYVYPNQPYEIYVCKYFFRASTLGRDSKAGTLVHEMSHFNNVAGTEDYEYGESNCLWLAQNYPSYAVKNADNHEYFAEDQ